MATRNTLKKLHFASLDGEGPVAASTTIECGKMVCRDSAGNIVEGATATTLTALGRAIETVDNSAGLAGAKTCKYEEGVFKWANSAAADEILVGDLPCACFIVNDLTVAKTDGTATRSIAGIALYVDSDGVWVAQGDYTSALCSSEADFTLLQVDARTTNAYQHIPLTSFLDADGDPLAKFVSASSPTFGFNLADSEALNLRWNNDATPGTALCQIGLPPDLDDTADMQLEFLCSKSGATVGDATTLLVTAFIVVEGDLHDADANAGGTTAALVGNAAAKTTDLLTLTITAANIPAGLGRTMTFTVTPTAGTLGTDDLMIHRVGLRYKRAQQAS